MAAKPLPSQEVLRQLLDYDPETGVLRWKERGPEWFANIGGKTAEHHRKRWNTCFAGREALSHVNEQGYRQGHILGRLYRAHRVIWKVAHGVDADEIDHMNGDRSDNRLRNLRNVPRVGNMRNRSRNANNKTGVTGVCRHKVTGKWAAKVGNAQLGTFDTFEEAVAARKAAERNLGYHENHGRHVAAL